MNRLAGFLCAACALFAIGGSLFAADTPLVGTWRVVGTLRGKDTILALVDISGDAKAPAIKVLTHGFPSIKGAEATKTAVKDGEISFLLANDVITLQAHFVVPESSTKFVAGHLILNGDLIPSHLAKTDQKDLKNVTIQSPTEGIDRFKAISTAESIDEKNKLAEALMKELPGRAVTHRASMLAIEAAVRSGKPEKALATADLLVQASKQFGRDYSIRLRAEVAEELAKEPQSAPKALEIIEAAIKEQGANPPPPLELPLLIVHQLALDKAGKKEEAAKITSKIDVIEAKLDEEFEKSNLPFSPKQYAGRKEEFNRVTVVELFTGAQCPPCVAADTAFDALIKTYQPKDVIFLQYHLHIPGADALTNPTTVARQEYYDKDILGTPTVLINGKATSKGLGGSKADSQDSYTQATELINGGLSGPRATTPINLKLDAGASGSKVGAEVTWSGLKEKDNLKLKAVLVEDVVRYPGPNGQRLHHHIVRDFPGGVKGVPIADAEGHHSFTVDLSKLRDSLKDYLANFEKESGPFPIAAKPLDLKKLKIVAFVQNEKTSEILQAAQANLEVK